MKLSAKFSFTLLTLFAPLSLAQAPPVALDLKAFIPFRFVAFGDTRFHDPADTEPANPAVRHALVSAVAQENPAFISIGGDIVYRGDDAKDWQVWDSETSLWRDRKIPVYPALGNHDLKGDEKSALSNYFQRFPDLRENRFYSVRVANSFMFVLDSALDGLSGPQGTWLAAQLDKIPPDVSFVFFIFHHPPYTSSSHQTSYCGGGHSARPPEQALAKMLEERQQHTRARFVVFSGHVHNYEHHIHGGVTYFVTGGGGARPYLIARAPGDLYRDLGVNYHYLLVEVERSSLKITMHKVEIKDSAPVWSVPDTVTIALPAGATAAASAKPR
jgi:acid phosphatase type 7